MCSSYSAHRFFIHIACVIALCATRCLDAPHDNPYDPENPNKAYLSINVNELGLFDLQGATVSLIHDGSTVQSDTSNEHGSLVFAEVDPGIYYLRAEATYFSAVEQGPETLWAGFEISRMIEMLTLNFDDEMPGVSTPHHLSSITGMWEIIEDYGQPEAHSIPRVYRGIDSSPEEIALSLCDTAAQYFLIETKLKVEESSSENWRTGIVFRYQNALNCYRLLLSPDTIQCYSLINGQLNDIRTVERESSVGVWHTIRVGRRQGEGLIRIRLDNETLFTLYDNIFLGGHVGLIVSNGDDFIPAVVDFDDVSIDLLYSYIQ
ncbi:MAG: carboxypeptidase-like regulatory domain-containing protein [candidate division WOR-3 bacterium]|nr:carboxypeptidase-like regulatory domain-containing protein [candidate division WOR-3 bacterium]